MHKTEDVTKALELLERLLKSERDRLLARNKVLEKKVEALESRLNTEMELGNRLAQYRDNAYAEKDTLQAKYNRLLARNNQLLVENAELEKRIEELE